MRATLILQRVLAVVVKEQGFGAALAFVVAAADADGVDVAPVGFDLRVHGGVAIDLAGAEAWKILARRRLARPSMLMAPCTLVLVVCTGSCW